MDEVNCKELIVSTLKRRGKGEPGDPIRAITEVYEKNGTKIAEHDPHATRLFTEHDLFELAKFTVNYLKHRDSEADEQVVLSEWLKGE